MKKLLALGCFIALLSITAARRSRRNNCHPHLPVDKIACCSVPEIQNKELKATCLEELSSLENAQLLELTETSTQSSDAALDESSDPPDSHEGDNHPEDDPGHPDHHKHRQYYHNHNWRRPFNNKFNCMGACVLNKTGILEDGIFNQDNLLTYLSNVLPDNKDLTEMIATSFENCVERLRSKKTLWSGYYRKYSLCSTYEHHLFSCVTWEIVKNCPVDRRNSDERCNQTRQRIEACGQQ